jgi:hypothetical protein
VQEVFRLNASSGAAPIVTYQGHWNQIGVLNSGTQVVPFYVNDKLALHTGSVVSGAIPLNITVKYI